MGVLNRLLLLLLLFPVPALAQESLRFDSADTRREKQALSINENKGLIAKIDLNDDLIDEYVIRSCNGSKFCNYSIIAFKDFKAIKIGDFKAHKIVVSREKTYGVRDLIVYNQQYNDFAFETAVWTPFRFYYHFSGNSSADTQ
jgi:hypothetical protein